MSMRWTSALKALLILALVGGAMAIPVGVVISFEPDGGTPAPELWRKKHLAQAVLLGGGATAITAVCVLYVVSQAERRRD
jgi:hypothetical protein